MLTRTLFIIGIVLIIVSLIATMIDRSKLIPLQSSRALLQSEVQGPEEELFDLDIILEPYSAAMNTLISFQPDKLEIEADDVGTVDILIENVTNLYGAGIQIQFNPDILQVQDADPDKNGVQISPGDIPSPDFIVTNEADNAAGSIRYLVSQLAPTPPFIRSGRVAAITFRAMGMALVT